MLVPLRIPFRTEHRFPPCTAKTLASMKAGDGVQHLLPELYTALLLVWACKTVGQAKLQPITTITIPRRAHSFTDCATPFILFSSHQGLSHTLQLIEPSSFTASS